MSYYRVLYIRDGGFLNYKMLEEYLMMGNCAKEMADISCFLSVRLENHLFFCFLPVVHTAQLFLVVNQLISIKSLEIVSQFWVGLASFTCV